MYPVDNDIHKWLKIELSKWERLADALYDIGCFLKSQRKRSPVACDDKLLRLWCRWEDAFPGKSFNKFHGMFCTIREFVHKYHMAGRISEESNEAYNGTLAETKKVLRSMPSTTKRIAKITERSQANLKGQVLEYRLKIQKATQGKVRGPQKPRAQVHDERAVLSMSGEFVEVDGERYVKLPDGNLLQESWVDIHDWFAGGRAPKEWILGLNKTAPDTFTASDRVKEENTQLV